MSYETILVSRQGPDNRQVGIITLNRPKQLNALNDQLMDELGAALTAFDADEQIGCITRKIENIAAATTLDEINLVTAVGPGDPVGALERLGYH